MGEKKKEIARKESSKKKWKSRNETKKDASKLGQVGKQLMKLAVDCLQFPKEPYLDQTLTEQVDSTVLLCVSAIFTEGMQFYLFLNGQFGASQKL